jgi:hypothetical protein
MLLSPASDAAEEAFRRGFVRKFDFPLWFLFKILLSGEATLLQAL